MSELRNMGVQEMCDLLTPTPPHYDRELARLRARIAYLERVATELETCFCEDPDIDPDAPECVTCKMWNRRRRP